MWALASPALLWSPHLNLSPSLLSIRFTPVLCLLLFHYQWTSSNTEIQRATLHQMLESYGGFRHLSISLNKGNLTDSPTALSICLWLLMTACCIQEHMMPCAVPSFVHATSMTKYLAWAKVLLDPKTTRASIPLEGTLSGRHSSWLFCSVFSDLQV